MSCNRSEVGRRSGAGPVALASLLALSLAACQTTPGDGGAAPTGAAPPPPPPAPAAAPAAPPPIYRVRGGSPSVLAKYPRGSEVSRDTRICLKDGEQISIVGSNGQSVTYVGPGCAQRTGRPTRENQGGFIFGWNGWGTPDVAVLP